MIITTTRTRHVINGHCSLENNSQKYRISDMTAAAIAVDFPEDFIGKNLLESYISEEGM